MSPAAALQESRPVSRSHASPRVARAHAGGHTQMDSTYDPTNTRIG